MRTVPLHGRIAAGRIALVDDADYDLVMAYRWYVYEILRPGYHPLGPYAMTSLYDKGWRSTLKMHKLIMGHAQVDHIDHDGLNNQRSNLRVATQTQQLGNTRKRFNKTSIYKGVFWNKDRHVWMVYIRTNGKSRYLGRFATEAEAAMAYDAAARELFGEYACLNFPTG